MVQKNSIGKIFEKLSVAKKDTSIKIKFPNFIFRESLSFILLSGQSVDILLNKAYYWRGKGILILYESIIFSLKFDPLEEDYYDSIHYFLLSLHEKAIYGTFLKNDKDLDINWLLHEGIYFLEHNEKRTSIN